MITTSIQLRLFLPIISLILCACAAAPDSNTKTFSIQETNAERAASCHFIGTANSGNTSGVIGTSNRSGNFTGGASPRPSLDIVEAVRNIAAAMEGTHIVWTENTKDAVSSADVYDCSEGSKASCRSKFGPILITECKRKPEA